MAGMAGRPSPRLALRFVRTAKSFKPHTFGMKSGMSLKFSLEPPAHFTDPRLKSGFNPGLWPLCNGTAGPEPGTMDLYERRCLEFLAVYYRLNRLNDQLRQARNRCASIERV